MNSIREFQTSEAARLISLYIETEAGSKRRYNIVEFNEKHTEVIKNFGITNLLPENTDIIHGPEITSFAMFNLLEQEKLESDSVKIDGFISPIIKDVNDDAENYIEIAVKYKKPIIMIGYDPLEIMQAVLNLVRAINQNEYGLILNS